MQTTSLSVRWTLAQVTRANASRERRLTLALVALLGMATISVLAATNALSQLHAREVAALTRP
jgi:hypothetical protein